MRPKSVFISRNIYKNPQKLIGTNFFQNQTAKTSIPGTCVNLILLERH